MYELPDDIERFFDHQELGKTGDNHKFTITCLYTIPIEGEPAPRMRQWRTAWSISGTELDRIGESGLADKREGYVAELKKIIRLSLWEQNAHLEIKGEQLWLVSNESED